ncbi:hypothetical protein [Mesonia sp. HuA40]|nr:hypothetical protein [Mesonia sp. HuA40]
MLQEILVLITFTGALLYLFTKLIWTPGFLKKKSSTKACGTTGKGCCD